MGCACIYHGGHSRCPSCLWARSPFFRWPSAWFSQGPSACFFCLPLSTWHHYLYLCFPGLLPEGRVCVFAYCLGVWCLLLHRHQASICWIGKNCTHPDHWERGSAFCRVPSVLSQFNLFPHLSPPFTFFLFLSSLLKFLFYSFRAFLLEPLLTKVKLKR